MNKKYTETFSHCYHFYIKVKGFFLLLQPAVNKITIEIETNKLKSNILRCQNQ